MHLLFKIVKKMLLIFFLFQGASVRGGSRVRTGRARTNIASRPFEPTGVHRASSASAPSVED